MWVPVGFSMFYKTVKLSNMFKIHLWSFDKMTKLYLEIVYSPRESHDIVVVSNTVEINSNCHSFFLFFIWFNKLVDLYPPQHIQSYINIYQFTLAPGIASSCFSNRSDVLAFDLPQSLSQSHRNCTSIHYNSIFKSEH